MSEDDDSIRVASNAIIDNVVLSAKPALSFQTKKITLAWPDTDYPFCHESRTWGSWTIDVANDADVANVIKAALQRGEIEEWEAEEIWSRYERDVRVRR